MVANGLHTKIICSSPSLINPISSYTADKDLSIDENVCNLIFSKKKDKYNIFLSCRMLINGLIQ
jgi:hypothetical protein